MQLSLNRRPVIYNAPNIIKLNIKKKTLNIALFDMATDDDKKDPRLIRFILVHANKVVDQRN